MTAEYVNATIHTLDKMRGVSEKKKRLLSEVSELTKRNLQGLGTEPVLSVGSVNLLYNGEKFATLQAISFWTINGETDLDLEVPLSLKRLYEKHTKEDELLQTLQEILVNCYKNEAIKQIPALKELFAQTDARLQEETQQILDDWKSLKEDIASLLG